MCSHLPQKTKHYSYNKDEGIGREREGQIWRGWKNNRKRGEKGRETEGEKEKARETERRIHLSTLELSTNTKPDPKTQSLIDSASIY